MSTPDLISMVTLIVTVLSTIVNLMWKGVYAWAFAEASSKKGQAPDLTEVLFQEKTWITLPFREPLLATSAAIFAGMVFRNQGSILVAVAAGFVALAVMASVKKVFD